ncbi:PEGA domain-containing protein [Lachnospiraceae bacterium 46-61]
MENKQNQNHTENGTNTGQNQNTISSMFWENFDNLDTKTELENIQSSKTDIAQNTEKMDTVIFSENKNIQQNNEDIEKTLEISSIVLSTNKEESYDDNIIELDKTIQIDIDAIDAAMTKQNDNISNAVEHTTDINTKPEHSTNTTNIELEHITDKNTVNAEPEHTTDTNIVNAESEHTIDTNTINTEPEHTTDTNTIANEELEQTKIIVPIQSYSSEETQRLDNIHEQTKKSAFSEILQKVESKDYTDDLGDKNAYLDTFESENFEEEENFDDEALNEEDDIYYDEETSFALYQAEKKRLKIILLCSIIIGIVVFLVGYIIMGMHQKEIREAQKRLQAEQASAIIDRRIVMVRTVATNRELSVHDINTDEEYIIKTNSDTKFINRSGQQSSVTKIQRGDLVSVVMNEDGQTAKQIQYSASTWMAKEVSGLIVDTEQKTVSITFVNGTETKTYHYGNDNLFLYKDGEIAPENIDPCDVVTMQGRSDRVWSIKVIESHGNMTITHQDDIVNGILTIDDDQIIALKDFTELAITEGVHNISVSGDNIESFSDTIFVVPNEDFEYDLSKAQSKTGVVIIHANVYDFKLYINGAEADGTKPIVLPLGEYDIVVSKNGYKKWNQKITVVEPSVTVDVNMEEDIQEGIISFHSVPEGAMIMWDNKEVGITPFDQKVRYGVYTVDVILEGYQPHRETIVVDKSAVDVTSYLTPNENTAETDQLQ